MKWISYNIFQNFPLFIIHRVRGTGVSHALILVLATKLGGADAHFHFFKCPPKIHGSGRTVKITLRCMVIGTCTVQFLHHINLYRNTQHYATLNCSVKTSLRAGST